MVGLALFFFFLVSVLGVTVMVLDEKVDNLTKKVEQLEQQSIGFYPASYQYLSDVNEFINKKGG